MEQLEIGPTPSEENAAQTGIDSLETIVRQARAYKQQVLRHYPPPDGALVKVKTFNHDFGAYAEVVLVFNPINEASTEWAYAAEADKKGLLRNWDEQARSELGM